MGRDYRIYIIDKNESVTGSITGVFMSDEQALVHAQSLLQITSTVELWQFDRRVERLERI